MARAAARHATRVVMTSDNPRSEDPEAILDEVAAGIEDRPGDWPLCDALRCVDRAAAIELAIREARPGSVVLIAGKGHETYQEIGGSVVPFDDRDVAQRVLEQVAAEGAEVERPAAAGGGWASAG
jgi:UDP-N-acetylmuramoyl-L-alanyl-D-glutamate--2,6-diaminopimelate ligase